MTLTPLWLTEKGSPPRGGDGQGWGIDPNSHKMPSHKESLWKTNNEAEGDIWERVKGGGTLKESG